jgi:hypothetical protein
MNGSSPAFLLGFTYTSDNGRGYTSCHAGAKLEASQGGVNIVLVLKSLTLSRLDALGFLHANRAG